MTIYNFVLFPSLRGLTYGSRISNFAKPASNWFKKKVRAVSHGRTHVTNFKILEHQNIIYFLFIDIFINFSINITIYAIIMAELTIIKYSKCYIYKPHLNFIKDGPLKKLFKLY